MSRREAVMLTGAALEALLDDLEAAKVRPHTLRVSFEGGLARYKFDSDTWSPPFDQPADDMRTH